MAVYCLALLEVNLLHLPLRDYAIAGGEMQAGRRR